MENESQPAPSTPPASSSSAPALSSPLFWILFALISITGTAFRLQDTASFRATGFDELIYRRYVYLMDGGKQRFQVFRGQFELPHFEVTIPGSGLGAMPALAELYNVTQKDPDAMCELPPTRVLYLYTAWCWKNIRYSGRPALEMSELSKERINPPTGPDRSTDTSRRDPALAALNDVSLGFSLLLMIAGGLFAWRMLGRAAGLGVLALMAFDPLQIHLSQHAMIDGVLSFWALMGLWTTWECLKNPASKAWLAAHTVGLALLVLTKENALFVYLGLMAAVAANRWLKFGTVTPRFLVCSLAGPAAGLLALITLCGGFEPFISIFRAFAAKAHDLPFSAETGDGPWHRYLFDLLTLSPIVLCLALGALFALGGKRKEIAFLAVFVIASYLILCNLRHGMNLRFAGIWGLPLRVAAFLMLWEICARFRRRPWLAAALLTAGICVYEARQYLIMVSDPRHPFYEVTPQAMLRQVKILKDRPDRPPEKAPSPSGSSSSGTTQ